MITPDDVPNKEGFISDDNQSFKTFLELFNDKVSHMNYQYSTSFIANNRPLASLVFMISDIKMPLSIAKKICEKYNEWGWIAKLYNGYCADGPFNAILLIPKDDPYKFARQIYGDERWEEIKVNYKEKYENNS